MDNQQRLQQANLLLQENRLPEARQLIREVIQSEPENADAWYLASFASEDRQQQIQTAQRALDLSPQHLGAARRLAELRGQAFQTNPPPIASTGEDDSDNILDSTPPQPDLNSRPAEPVAASRTRKIGTVNPTVRLVAIGGLVLILVLVGMILLVQWIGNLQRQQAQVSKDQTAIAANLTVIAQAATNVAVTQSPVSVTADIATPTTTVTITVVPVTQNTPSPVPSVESPGPTNEAVISGVPITSIQFVGEKLNSGFKHIFLITPDNLSPIDLSLDGHEEVNAEWSPSGEMIAYVDQAESNSSEQYSLNIINVLNKSRFGWFDESVTPAYPIWSPDGSKLLFASVKSGDSDDQKLYLVRPDSGSNPQLVATDLEMYNGEPRWSPDSRFVAYMADGGAINLLDTDSIGSPPVRVAKGWMVSWSPDGTRLAYGCSNPSDDYALCLSNRDGSNLQILDLSVENKYELPLWSPDGNKVAFLESRIASNDRGRYLDIVNADGTGLINTGVEVALQTSYFGSAPAAWGPIWSPDSRYIYVKRSFYSLSRVASDGSGSIPVIDSPWSISDYDLSPDGSQVLLVLLNKFHDHDSKLFIGNSDGTNLTVITNDAFYVRVARWKK